MNGKFEGSELNQWVRNGTRFGCVSTLTAQVGLGKIYSLVSAHRRRLPGTKESRIVCSFESRFGRIDNDNGGPLRRFAESQLAQDRSPRHAKGWICMITAYPGHVPNRSPLDLAILRY